MTDPKMTRDQALDVLATGLTLATQDPGAQAEYRSALSALVGGEGEGEGAEARERSDSLPYALLLVLDEALPGWQSDDGNDGDDKIVAEMVAAIRRLAEERDEARSVCAEAYQLAGALHASEKALDNLSDAASGRPLRRGTFLPIMEGDCAWCKAAEADRDALKAIVGRAHIALGENADSDDDTLPDAIAAVVAGCNELAKRHDTLKARLDAQPKVDYEAAEVIARRLFNTGFTAMGETKAIIDAALRSTSRGGGEAGPMADESVPRCAACDEPSTHRDANGHYRCEDHRIDSSPQAPSPSPATVKWETCGGLGRVCADCGESWSTQHDHCERRGNVPCASCHPLAPVESRLEEGRGSVETIFEAWTLDRFGPDFGPDVCGPREYAELQAAFSAGHSRSAPKPAVSREDLAKAIRSAYYKPETWEGISDAARSNWLAAADAAIEAGVGRRS